MCCRDGGSIHGPTARVVALHMPFMQTRMAKMCARRMEEMMNGEKKAEPCVCPLCEGVCAAHIHRRNLE